MLIYHGAALLTRYNCFRDLGCQFDCLRLLQESSLRSLWEWKWAGLRIRQHHHHCLYVVKTYGTFVISSQQSYLGRAQIAENVETDSRPIASVNRSHRYRGHTTTKRRGLIYQRSNKVDVAIIPTA